MVDLRFLHSALPTFIVEELQNRIERLIWIVHHIRKGSALNFFQEHFARNHHVWHIRLQLIAGISHLSVQLLDVYVSQLHILYVNMARRQSQIEDLAHSVRKPYRRRLYSTCTNDFTPTI